MNLFITRILWFLTPKTSRRPWSMVKSGMQKHKCNFTGPSKYISGVEFYTCTHYGCNMLDPAPDPMDAIIDLKIAHFLKKEGIKK